MIVFDSFNKKDFESRIKKRISEMENVIRIQPANSELVPGIMFIDNLCGVLRLKECGEDINHFYEIIEHIVVDV